ncbi:splicing regulator RBM11 [Amia ocellicauda]|uniref:splicing regulator RBM11 n=1 Tax=Amia ocellicauda TaxID=2972642 RepID=UPI003463FEBF
MYNNHNEADKTVFVGNLDSCVKEEILFELFLQAGPLTRVTIAKDKDGKQKSYGFVCYKHREAVPYAIALLNGIRLYGRPIKLQYRFGSSHSDVDMVLPSMESSPSKVLPDTFRTGNYQEPPLFPNSTLTVNSCNSQEYVYFQNMISGFPVQQYSMDSQMAMQQYYLPNALSQQSSMTSMPWSAQGFLAGSSYSCWPHTQPVQTGVNSKCTALSQESEGQVENQSSRDQSKERRYKKRRDSKNVYKKHRSKCKM